MLLVSPSEPVSATATLLYNFISNLHLLFSRLYFVLDREYNIYLYGSEGLYKWLYSFVNVIYMDCRHKLFKSHVEFIDFTVFTHTSHFK